MIGNNQTPQTLLDSACNGDRRSLARLLSYAESDLQHVAAVSAALTSTGHQRPIIGITGAPGAGKSSLTDRMIQSFRADGQTVAALCIDPSSPFTGGAILGDRVRMQQHVEDAGVFIRSMATRGHLGGLAVAAPLALRIFDAIGFDHLIVETVGVGQVEVDIAGAADTTIVVVNPGWGDGVQASKAGLLEIADVFVINKADRPGVEATRKDLQLMLELSFADRPSEDWRPPIIATSATEQTGVDELMKSLGQHQQWLDQSGQGAQRRQMRTDAELSSALQTSIEQLVAARSARGEFDQIRDDVRNNRLDVWSAAQRVVAQALSNEESPSE